MNITTWLQRIKDTQGYYLRVIGHQLLSCVFSRTGRTKNISGVHAFNRRHHPEEPLLMLELGQ